MSIIDDALAPYLEDFFTERVDELTEEGAQLPEFICNQQEIDRFCKRENIHLDPQTLEELISVIRSNEFFIREHIYCTGLADGIRLCGIMKQIQQS